MGRGTECQGQKFIQRRVHKQAQNLSCFQTLVDDLFWNTKDIEKPLDSKAIIFIQELAGTRKKL